MGFFSWLANKASALFPSRGEPTVKTAPPEQQSPNHAPSEQAEVLPFVEPTFQIFTEWTTSEILSALNSHELGSFVSSGQLWTWMGRDDRMQTELGKREKGLNALPFTLQTASVGQGIPEEEEVRATLEEQWFQCFPEETIAQLIRVTVGMGFALCQILWDVRRDHKGKLLWWPRLKVWDAQFTYYDDFLKKFRVQTESGFKYVTPGDGQWFLYMPSGDKGWLNGAVRCLALPCFVTNFDWQDWAEFNAAVGHPVKVAYVARGANKVSVDKFIANLNALGRYTSYLLAQKNQDDTGYDFEYKVPTNIATATFKDSIDYSNKAKTLVILGQAGTTDAVTGGIGTGFADVHKQILGTILKSDANSLSTAIRNQILTWFAYWNFGDSRLAPWPTWDSTPPQDKKAKAETLIAAATALEKVQASLKGTGKTVDTVKYWEENGLVLIDDKSSQLAKIVTPATDASGKKLPQN